MTVCLTGYDTLAGRGLVIKPVIDLAKKAIIQSNFADNNSTLNAVDLGSATNPAVALLTTITPEESTIPPLVFPLLVDIGQDANRKSGSYVVVDVRPYLYSDKLTAGNSLNIKNKDDYEFFVINALLTASWIKENKRNTFRFLGTAPMSVYCTLISNVLERRFALDPGEQLKIAIIGGAFYTRLFTSATAIVEEEKIIVSKAIISAIKAPADMVYETLDLIENLSNIDDLINEIKRILQNPRLDALNLGTFVTIINAMWYGPYGKELIIAALEHPPTWITILYKAYTDRGMKKSGVTQTAERFKGSRGGDDFIRNMKNLVANAKTEV